MNVLTIAYLTFLEARHRKLLWAVVIMGAAFFNMLGDENPATQDYRSKLAMAIF